MLMSKCQTVQVVPFSSLPLTAFRSNFCLTMWFRLFYVFLFGFKPFVYACTSDTYLPIDASHKRKIGIFMNIEAKVLLFNFLNNNLLDKQVHLYCHKGKEKTNKFSKQQ